MSSTCVIVVLVLTILVPVGQASGQAPTTPATNGASTTKPADAATIERLIRQLGSEGFKEREAADKALRAIGNPALSALREAQKDRDPEVRRRAADLVRKLLQHRALMRAKAWRTYLEKTTREHNTELPPEGELRGLHFGAPATYRDEDLTLLQWLDDPLSVTFEKSASVTDKGLVHLKSLYQLSRLDLSSTKVTDTGIIHLKDIKTLQSLDLYNTQIRGAGLVHLKNLPRLHSLGLGNTQITDEKLVHLKNFPQLERLILADTRITDGGLDYVVGLSKLTWLILSHTAITDAGLAKLKRLRHLRTLYVEETQVTDEGAAELLKAVPRIELIRWGNKNEPKIVQRRVP